MSGFTVYRACSREPFRVLEAIMVKRATFARRALEWFVKWVNRPAFALFSGEFLLYLWGRNGGAVVAVRSLWITALLVLGARAYCGLGPQCADRTTLVTWAGAALGAVFFALHARFASQWAYLAGVYNQIKQTEASTATDATQAAMAQWKAGFIEDCRELHLAGKPTFSYTISAWLQQEGVEAALEAATGKRHVEELKELVARNWGKRRR